MKELVWECGGDKVRWVLHGTPASGTGIVGVLEMGASVVCLCEDSHHKVGFEQALQERCVEVMLAGSRVFKSSALQARAAKLCPAAPGRAKAETASKATANKDDDDDDRQQARTTSKATANKGSKAKGASKRKKKQTSAKKQAPGKAAKKQRRTKKDDEDEEDESASEDSEKDEEDDEE